MTDLRTKALSVALREHRGYLEHTRSHGPSFTGKAGRVAHELHEAKMALLVELLEAEAARLEQVQEVVLEDGCVDGHSPSLVSCALGSDWP